MKGSVKGEEHGRGSSARAGNEEEREEPRSLLRGAAQPSGRLRLVCSHALCAGRLTPHPAARLAQPVECCVRLSRLRRALERRSLNDLFVAASHFFQRCKLIRQGICVILALLSSV